MIGVAQKMIFPFRRGDFLVQDNSGIEGLQDLASLTVKKSHGELSHEVRMSLREFTYIPRNDELPEI